MAEASNATPINKDKRQDDVRRVKELISTMQRNATDECPFRHRYALFDHST
jgi:hypothetical protein